MHKEEIERLQLQVLREYKKEEEKSKSTISRALKEIDEACLTITGTMYPEISKRKSITIWCERPEESEKYFMKALIMRRGEANLDEMCDELREVNRDEVRGCIKEIGERLAKEDKIEILNKDNKKTCMFKLK